MAAREKNVDLNIRAKDNFSAVLGKGKKALDAFKESMSTVQGRKDAFSAMRSSVSSLQSELARLKDTYAAYNAQMRENPSRDVAVAMVNTRARIYEVKAALEQTAAASAKLMNPKGFVGFSQQADKAKAAYMSTEQTISRIKDRLVEMRIEQERAAATAAKYAANQATANRVGPGFGAANASLGAKAAGDAAALKDEIVRLESEMQRLNGVTDKVAASNAALTSRFQQNAAAQVATVSAAKGSFLQFSRNADAMQTSTTAVSQNTAALAALSRASAPVVAGQNQMKTAIDRATVSMQRQTGIAQRNRAAGQSGARGEDQDVEMYGLRPYQMVNLGYQVNDVISGLAMGQAPIQILAQQAGQFAQIWPQVMVGLIRALPILAGLTAAFAPLIAAMVRVRKESESTKTFTSALALMADGALYSADSLAKVSAQMEKLGATTEEARGIVKSLLGAGFAEADMLPLVRMADRLSDVTGEKLPDAVERLRTAFSGGVDGVRELDRELNFLTADQLESIRVMEESGDRAGAVSAAQDILAGKLAATVREATPWSTAVSELSAAWEKLVTAMANSGVIELAAKGLDLLAVSARGAAMTVDAVADVFTEDDPVTAARKEYKRLDDLRKDLLKQLAQRKKDDAEVLEQFGSGGATGIESPFFNSSIELEQQLTDIERQIAAALDKYNTAVAENSTSGAAADALIAETEAQKKLQGDINALIDDQVDGIRQETELAALGNRERFIEQELLKAKNEALALALKQGREFNGLTEEQTKLLREQAGINFDRQQSDAYVAGGAGSAVDRIVGIESGGDPNAKNPNSSATGLGQFISATWLAMFKKYFPDRAASLSDAMILELRKDATLSRKMVEIYAQENAKVLQSAGVAVNDAAVYLAHFLGPQGALNVLQAAPNTPVDQVLGADQISANAGILEGRTAQEVIAWAQQKMSITDAELAATERLGALDDERLKKAQEYNEAYRQRIEGQQFELSLQDQSARQAAIAKAIRDEELEAQKAGIELTKAQRDEIAATTGALFDRQNVEAEVNRLLEIRSALVESLTIAQDSGNRGAVEAVRTEIATTDANLRTAIDSAIAFWQSMGGPQADAAILKLQNLRGGLKDVGNETIVTGKQIDEMLASGGANAFDQFAQSVANGEGALESLGNAFRSFAADFLRQIAQMIIQQAILNALQGVGGGGGIGGTIANAVNAMVRHDGGIAGGAGRTRMVNPAIFAGAPRYHTGKGMGLKPNEVPAILEADEEVLTRQDPRHVANGGGGSTGTSVKVVNVIDPGDVMEAGLATEAGERAHLNFVMNNRSKIRGALGV